MKPPLLEDNANPLFQDQPWQFSQINWCLCWGSRTHLLSAFIYSCSHSFSRHFWRANCGPWACWGNAGLWNGDCAWHTVSAHCTSILKWNEHRWVRHDVLHSHHLWGGWDGTPLLVSLPSLNNNFGFLWVRPSYAKCFRHINSLNPRNTLESGYRWVLSIFIGDLKRYGRNTREQWFQNVDSGPGQLIGTSFCTPKGRGTPSSAPH